MAGTAKCLSLVKGRRIRLTRLDACGRPVYGESSSVVSKGFVSVAFSANTNDGNEINVTNAAGESCIYEPAVPTLTGYGLEIVFCDVDLDLFALVTGNPVVTNDDGDVIGFDIDVDTDLTGSGFALELWAGVNSGDACANDASQGSYGYILVPFAQGGIVGDFTVENDAVSFTLTGANTKKGNAWGVGPYSDIMIDSSDAPGPMVKAIGSSVALRLIETDVTPPVAACGTRPLLDPSVPNLTTATKTTTTGSLLVNFNVTPSSVATPVWWDFGDGEWDYTDPSANGAVAHTYAAAGTYTAKASSNGKVWRSVSVTVPGA
jgi:hypothetical protein